MQDFNQLATLEHFWRNQFKRCDEVTYLSETTGSADGEIASLTTELSKEQSEKLRRWSNRRGMSVYVCFLAIMALYINRTHANTELFYLGFQKQKRVFPVLCSFKNEETFVSFADKIEASADASIEYATIDLQEIFALGTYDVDFDKSWFDVLVGDSSVDAQALFKNNLQLNLFVEVIDKDGENIHLRFHYRRDVFSKNDVEAILRRLETLINSAFDEHNEYKHLYQLHMLPEDEYNKLLHTFAGQERAFESNKTVHQIFEEHAALHPEKIALIAPDKTLTYQELNICANRFAHALIARGLEQGDRVAFALPRDSRAIITMLGILKAGAAYVPVDPYYPDDRRDFIIEDSQAKLYITEDTYGSFVSDNEANPHVVMTSRDYCYCLFTSGSTGRPKGTLLHHQGLINLVCNLDIYKDVSDVKRIGFLTTLTFDVATQGIFTAFLNGFTGVFLPEPSQTPIQTVTDQILDYEVDVIFSSPSYFDTLTADEKNARKLLSQLKIVALAGEAFYLNNTVNAIRDAYPTRFENQYGPVELHVIVATKTVEDKKTISIGKPLPNAYAYIVDSYNNLLPYGCIGELCFAGVCVGGGYLNRPEITEQKFVWDPFENPFGYGKLYKTGDLARWNKDGELEYMGRNDFLVKIRGLRVEMGEIESALAEVPHILQTACVVQKDKEGHQRIVAFYTAEKDVAQETLNQHLNKMLPHYMIPNIYVKLDDLPKTTSGKIDRKRLPEVAFGEESTQHEYVAPKTDLQKQLTELFQAVLDAKKVGIKDDFFELGGDSLQAIELITKAQDEGLNIPLQHVFDYPNIAALETALLKTSKTEATDKHADFSDLLKNNTLQDKLKMFKEVPINTALVTGATGFFGAHLVHALIQNTNATLYCLTRGTPAHLLDSLRFYFGDAFLIRARDRIKPVLATLETLNTVEIDQPIDMVFHAAAQVKHYGNVEDFTQANVDGTQNVIEFCLKHNAKLIHFSTVSVAGDSVDNLDNPKRDELVFTEQNLWVGQSLENLYCSSKFKAEELVLEAMNTKGLEANIIRLGNLTNRSQDLVFQPNYADNAFYLRIKALLGLGVLPEYLQDDLWEFSPVDESAEAAVAIAKHFNTTYTVFHCFHPTGVAAKTVFDQFGNVQIVDNTKFLEKLNAPENSQHKTGLIMYLDPEMKMHFEEAFPVDNAFTTAYLNMLGHTWSDIDEQYLTRYITYFKDMQLL